MSFINNLVSALVLNALLISSSKTCSTCNCQVSNCSKGLDWCTYYEMVVLEAMVAQPYIWRGTLPISLLRRHNTSGQRRRT
ncbi:hypothetical protein BDR07DRAFT_1438762 [Suillus spraguei]|nr:hypothetical protein BDR07DRAFT_1438762 [Suillus spraguei]